jgi:hypothetical protein
MAVAKEVLPALGRPLPGKKLGKEVFEEFMVIARRMAARYQPAAPGQPKKPGQNEAKFLRRHPGDRAEPAARSWRCVAIPA